MKALAKAHPGLTLRDAMPMLHELWGDVVQPWPEDAAAGEALNGETR